jgi:hypothetical protein
MVSGSERHIRQKRCGQDTDKADDIYRLMKLCDPGFPVELLRLGERLPPGFQEIFRNSLFDIVCHLDREGVEDGKAKETTIRHWAVAYREQLGRTEWLFPPGVPPELLNDARQVARLLAAIDIANEQGDREMLDFLGGHDNPSFDLLRAALASREHASQGGQAKRDKYLYYVSEWRKEWNRIKLDNPSLSNTRTSDIVADCHKRTYKNSNDPETIKTVTGKTIRKHLAR